MALNFNDYQIQLGRAMGLNKIDSQRDLDQINAFARQYGVGSVDSQNDLNQLLPMVKPYQETAPGSNVWTNPNNFTSNTGTFPGAPAPPPATPPPAATPPASGGPNSLPGTAANGSASSIDFQALLMQQQASLEAQNQAFMQAQQQFAQQQAAAQAQMQQQLLAAQNTAAATTPGAIAGAEQAVSGWTPNRKGVTSLESLLLGSTAATGAMQMVVA